LAIVYELQNDYQQALAHMERALAIYKELGDKIAIAISKYQMASLYRSLGAYERAPQIHQE
jgi:tetratricopeptide (TPR) repeat protein